MTIQEIEAACDAARPIDFSRHHLEAPELKLHKTFYPYGFPVEVRTNSKAILSMYADAWLAFKRRFSTSKIIVDVHITEGGSTECPPAPVFYMMQPTLLHIADAHNHSVVHIGANHTQVTLSRSTLQHERYLKYFFLTPAAAAHIVTQFTTPVHAACVSLNQRGVLLCGDSGAGKSSLAYACARAGWTFTSDDASFLLHSTECRTVTGDCYHVRLRPTAADLFPEINGLKMTPRAAGKPSLEMLTSTVPDLICAQNARIDFMVFLNRRKGAPPQLQTYRKEIARAYLRSNLHGSPESVAIQNHAIERLLTAEVFEMRYTDIDWAIRRLRELVRDGR